ncbi:hypothetical protein SAE01_11960 [Segetibacter aerophilus]|uniref:Uncharacterized protein n=1 Tax=Segetibacter aerophilus TaxID=670293 RepID=A0A512B9R1_9BACT|nr:hypothetical protein SAE01_11960 [Segetibacter aerophilus]
MNAGRRVALMELSEYCIVGIAKYPPSDGFVCLPVGSHETKHQDSYERGVMLAKRMFFNTDVESKEAASNK